MILGIILSCMCYLLLHLFVITPPLSVPGAGIDFWQATTSFKITLFARASRAENTRQGHVFN